MYKEILEKEVNLLEDEGCIVFDFGCYFPYSNSEILTFSFHLGMEELKDYKMNHRYPNKHYQTITKKYKRGKLSKIGYPYIMKLEEQGTFLLNLIVGIKEEQVNLVFPIETNLSKDKPICGLSLRYDFDEQKFKFTTQKIGDHVICQSWSNYTDDMDKRVITFSYPEKMNNTYIFNEVITPFASNFSEFILL